PVPGQGQAAAPPAVGLIAPPAPAQGQPLKPVPLAGTAPPAPVGAQGQPLRRLDELRHERREVVESGRTVIREADRGSIREQNQIIIRHNEIDRFRYNARDVTVERVGGENVTVVVRPDGSRIVNVLDDSGNLVRRVRRAPDGREIIIIDNRAVRVAGPATFFVDLPPPVVRIPRERYIVETERASRDDIFAVLVAPPVDRIERGYSLDEIRFSANLRERMPRIDLDTVNFEFGSWEVTPDQVNRLAVIAEGITRAIQRNPSEVFLIEGHTDAVGSDVDNLSLSDRRAESVAVVLTNQLNVPPENLTSQGYGKQYLKIPTEAPERQ